MDAEAVSDHSTDGTQTPVSSPFPTRGRVIYGLFVTALPAISFWATDLIKPEWQDRKLSSYIALLLSPEASLLFLFLLAYSIICFWLLLFAPSRFSNSFVVRTGIYTGVLLALQYSILVFICSFSVSVYLLILSWIFLLVGPVIYRWVVARWPTATVINVLMILAVLGLVVSFWTQTGLILILMVLLMAAPFLSFLIALRAALWLFKNYETMFNLPHGLGIAAWFAAYAAAWRFDILKMYELYAALPKDPPNCYIATAAARGHSRFVQAWTVQCADGKSMRVNAQLQRLKCAELALMAVNPPIHQFLRQIYDMLGKYLASRIQNPFLADIAYLLLKPCEWFAGLLLKMVVPEIDLISKKMYM